MYNKRTKSVMESFNIVVDSVVNRTSDMQKEDDMLNIMDFS